MSHIFRAGNYAHIGKKVMRKAKSDIEELTGEQLKKLRRYMKQKLDQVQKWRDEGRCPKCGKLGKFINFQMKCPEHGPYGQGIDKPETRKCGEKFDGGDCWLDNDLDDGELVNKGCDGCDDCDTEWYDLFGSPMRANGD